MDSLTELFCMMDDFCRLFEPTWERRLLASGTKKRKRRSELSLPELMTLAVLFHQLRFRQFKSFYLGYACRHLRAEFPKLPSYGRCVELMPRCAIPLATLFEALKGQCGGISIADATSLAVCDNKRIPRHRSVFNFLVDLMAGTVAHCPSDKKPTLKLIRVNVPAKA